MPTPAPRPPHLPRVDGARETALEMVIRYPTYGKPEQDIDTAANVKSILRTGLHSQVEVWLVSDGRMVEIDDRHWEHVL